MKHTSCSRIFFALLVALSSAVAQEKPMKQWSDAEYNHWAKKFFAPRTSGWSLQKPTAGVDRKAKGVIDGNRIETLVSNFGSIGAPRQYPSVVWPKGTGRSMGYEFGPMAGAEVVDKNGKTIHIMDDALIDGGERQNPNKSTGNVMGWEPLPGYAADKPNESIAISTKPETWPPGWRINGWPGRFGNGVITADEEAYTVMDDRFNDEFEYYPLQNGSDSIRGLGLQLSFRTYQFAAGPAQDILFLLYELKLRSDCKPLNKVVVGMVGDPHIGGPADYADDWAGFDRSRNMVYAYDDPGSSNDYGVANVGYLGFMFIQPPGIKDTNWLPLTSFNAPIYGSVSASDDERMWQLFAPDLGPSDPPPVIAQKADNLFIFGSGYFSLQPGQTQKFAIAIVMGVDLNNTTHNADNALKIASLDFQFARPPEPPTVTAIPGDKRATIYWDGTKSENSIDPFSGLKDFEGYRIYRSDDKGITWGKPITDNRGNQVMWEPLAIFDKKDGILGTHPIETAPGIHYYLGDDSGLQYVYTDTSLDLRNGVTYHYAVTSYDKGDSLLLPLENSMNLGAINVVSVTPDAPPVGLQHAGVDSIQHTSGSATGKVSVDVLDEFVVKGNPYKITFAPTAQKPFTITRMNGDTVVSNSGTTLNPQINGERSYVFEGLKLDVDDEDAVLLDGSKTKWTAGSANLRLLIERITGGAADAAKYQIRFSDAVLDTSLTGFGRSAVPLRFAVNDISRNNQRVGIIYFTDGGKKDTIDVGDQILLLKDVTAPIALNNVEWRITFLNPTDTTLKPVIPSKNDVFAFSTTIPFNATLQDVYTVYPRAAVQRLSGNLASELDKIKVVPDPYITASRFETKTPFRTGRGERVIKFTHLPTQCTIRIFTVAGEHVATINHLGDLRNGSEQSWNLLNKDGLDVAPGLYIYHIDAPHIGEKIGRFAIIK